MTREEIVTELKTFLETEFPNDGVELTETTNLLEEWLADSLGLTEIVVFVEERFGVRLTGADLNDTNFRDVASVSRLVESRLGS